MGRVQWLGLGVSNFLAELSDEVGVGVAVDNGRVLDVQSLWYGVKFGRVADANAITLPTSGLPPFCCLFLPLA